MNDYIHIYTYIFKVKMGMINHSSYDHYLIIGNLVNGKFQEIWDQILPVRRQTREEWILLTKLLRCILITILIIINTPKFDNPKQPFLLVVVVC